MPKTDTSTAAPVTAAATFHSCVKTKTAVDQLDQERRQHYDNLTLAACVIGELKALFSALALMRGGAGCDGDIRRLIGIGQDIGDRWETSFKEEAEKIKPADRPEPEGAAP